MKKEPKISIIVPVYKVEQYLEKCVNSITNQIYKNLEIILVDDGSPDSSPDLCDKLAKQDKRIKVIHKQNGGVSSARNEGLKQATGDYVAFVDSDDWIEKEMYQEMQELAVKTDSDMVFAKTRQIYADGKISHINEINLPKLRNKEIIYFFSNARSGEDSVSIFGGPCRMLVKSEIAKSCTFSTKLKHGEDLFFVLDCVEKAEKIEVIEKYFYNYFFNTSSVTNSIGKNYFQNIKDLHIYAKNYIKEKNYDFDFLVNQAYLYRNVINRANQKDFVKQMKDLYASDELFRECFNKKNYKRAQKFELGFKQKVRNFLMYHKMWRLFKLLANKK